MAYAIFIFEDYAQFPAILHEILYLTLNGVYIISWFEPILRVAQIAVFYEYSKPINEIELPWVNIHG